MAGQTASIGDNGVVEHTVELVLNDPTIIGFLVDVTNQKMGRARIDENGACDHAWWQEHNAAMVELLQQVTVFFT